jgi:hypothetical protein
MTVEFVERPRVYPHGKVARPPARFYTYRCKECGLMSWEKRHPGAHRTVCHWCAVDLTQLDSVDLNDNWLPEFAQRPHTLQPEAAIDGRERQTPGSVYQRALELERQVQLLTWLLRSVTEEPPCCSHCTQPQPQEGNGDH